MRHHVKRKEHAWGSKQILEAIRMKVFRDGISEEGRHIFFKRMQQVVDRYREQRTIWSP